MRALAAVALRQVADVELLEADGGEAALRWIATVPIALVITDVQMPGIDGNELIARVRADPAAQETTLIIAMSADAHNLVRSQELGANATIAKPFRADRLIGLVEELLRPS